MPNQTARSVHPSHAYIYIHFAYTQTYTKYTPILPNFPSLPKLIPTPIHFPLPYPHSKLGNSALYSLANSLLSQLRLDALESPLLLRPCVRKYPLAPSTSFNFANVNCCCVSACLWWWVVVVDESPGGERGGDKAAVDEEEDGWYAW